MTWLTNLLQALLNLFRRDAPELEGEPTPDSNPDPDPPKTRPVSPEDEDTLPPPQPETVEDVLEEVPTKVGSTLTRKPSMPPNILDKPLSKFYEGRPRTPWVIVVHYSAGYNAEDCHNVLEKRGLSVHATIERDGTIWREVADENRAIHAGYGRWGGLSGMNSHSLGFEIANLGYMEGINDGSKGFRGREVNPMRDGNTYYRIEGPNKTRVLTETQCAQFPDHRPETKDYYWSVYPSAQLDSVFWLMWKWVKTYNILPENVVGHEHVTPHRKKDPGPAFPWREWEIYLNEKCELEKPELLNPTHRKRERLKAVQSHCARLGLSVGDIDGWWGTNTEAAVKKAVVSYGALYGFDSLDVNEDNALAIANALRLIPGFDPQRA